MTGAIRNRMGAVQEGLDLLNPRGASVEEMTETNIDRRVPYAAMNAHRERAAMAIATGATMKMAAAYAGVSVRQIKKYYEISDFRARIEEHRTVLMSRIRGRLLKEMGRRTAPTAIKRMELLDLLRVYDRMSGTTGGRGGVQIGEMNVNQTNYDTLVSALFTTNSGPEGGDFPELVIDGSPLPAGDTQQ
jgi:hypothetical protein